MMHAPGIDVALLKSRDSYFGGWAEMHSLVFGGDARFNEDEEHQAFLAGLSGRSGQSIPNLDAWCREERRFTAQEALELGFLDAIV